MASASGEHFSPVFVLTYRELTVIERYEKVGRSASPDTIANRTTARSRYRQSRHRLRRQWVKVANDQDRRRAIVGGVDSYLIAFDSVVSGVQANANPPVGIRVSRCEVPDKYIPANIEYSRLGRGWRRFSRWRRARQGPTNHKHER